MKSYNFLFTKILLVKNVLFSPNNTYFTNSTIYNLTNIKTINIFSIIFKFLIFIKARTIYYVNNGERKSHGDVQKKNKWNATAAEKREYAINNGKPMPPDSTEIVLNCYLIDDKYISETPDKLGEYNIPRYMAAFNKRIEPLLVVFSPEIRSEILVDNPDDRPFFTKSQTKLVRGFPHERR